MVNTPSPSFVNRGRGGTGGEASSVVTGRGSKANPHPLNLKDILCAADSVVTPTGGARLSHLALVVAVEKKPNPLEPE